MVSVFVSLRRLARRALPAVGAFLLSAVVAIHAAHPLDERVFAGFILLVLALIAVRAWQRTSALDPSPLRDIELGVLLGVAAHATAVHVDGGLDGTYYPLVYVAMGVMSAFAKPGASLVVIGLMMAFEAAVRLLTLGEIEPQRLLPHLGFAIVFALLNTLSLRMEVARLRKASKSELQAERDRIQDEARSYRLLRAPLDGGPESGPRDEERLLRSGVQEIELGVLYALRLLRACLGIRTAMLLWLDDDETQLRIAELVTDDADLCEGPFSTRDGILGAVLNQRAPVSVAPLKPSYVLPYYPGACPVQSVCAVPVYEHGALRGVLVVDRESPTAFTADEQDLVEQAARFCARAIENERVFVQLERTKVEQGRLYRASERLGAAISEQEVVDAGVSSAREIAAVDFAAFTSYDAAGDVHQIRRVSGPAAEALTGRRFRSNKGLVSMALKNRHPLPYRGEYDASHQLVFEKGASPPDLPSLIVLPLLVHDEPLGTLVLGSEQPGAFTEAARALLEVLARHLAVSLSNARMVRQLEEKATTDGLTGLLNKRAMLETADEKIRAAMRFGRELSVLVADIDHFKNVNDTYGHDVGDIVIKELGAIHSRVKRTTDAVARFGGEEFVTICEETDAEGAQLLAERIRTELEKTVFHVDGKEVRCTCSIGIATFPLGGESWEELFKAADGALYVSKRGGRNQCTVFEPGKTGHHAA
ncbi:MAG: GGDEF domain-containing protein [Myxococcales bacterium]|nr:GGDEF domain-containing protein [Myxococcales bacterium]